MLFFTILWLGVLAFGPQAVLSLITLKFQISEVKQCEPVTMTFVGNTGPDAIPMFLTLIPFGSSPLSIPIPNAAADSSGVYVTFVPFAAGTNFVASLDDATGENVAKVSDVIRVLPSDTGNTTCLPTGPSPTFFTLNNSTFSQCEEFTLSYDRSVISRAPSGRFYSPKGSSRVLKLKSDDPTTGTATYVMNFDRGKQVVFVFDDGSAHQESSGLISIVGDTSSTKDCIVPDLKVDNIAGDSKQDSQGAQSMPGVSQGVVIGSAVGGGVVVLITIALLIFVLRERRRRQKAKKEQNPSLIEKGRPTSPFNPQTTPFAEDRRTPGPTAYTNPRGSPPHISPTVREMDASSGYVRDPPYTAEKFLSPTTAFYPRQSMASWGQPTPEDQRFPPRSSDDAFPRDVDTLSINSLDIEGILNMVHSNRSSAQTAEPMPLGPTLRSPTHLMVPGSYSSRHLRNPSDVPVDPTSMASALTLSSVIDPFADGAVKEPSHVQTRNPRSGPSIKAPPSAADLPTSPIDPYGSRSSNRSTKGSMGDYYGAR